MLTHCITRDRKLGRFKSRVLKVESNLIKPYQNFIPVKFVIKTSNFLSSCEKESLIHLITCDKLQGR